MSISYTTYMKIFALSYLMSFIIAATFEDAILHTFLFIYLEWLEKFGIKLRPNFHFSDAPHPAGDLKRRSFWTSSQTSGVVGDSHQVVRVDDLPVSPTRPGHSLSIGILAIIAGACFLLLMSLFLGLYCCCIRRRASDNLKLQNSAMDIEKGHTTTLDGDIPYDKKISTPTRVTPIPAFEFSPPSPTWVPSLPTLTTAIRVQAHQYYDHTRLHPAALSETNREYAHTNSQTRTIRHNVPRASVEPVKEGTPSIKILINDEERDTDAVIASSSPLMRRAVSRSEPTVPAPPVKVNTTGVSASRKGGQQTISQAGLGISTLDLASASSQSKNERKYYKTPDAQLPSSAVKDVQSKPGTETKGGTRSQEAKRDTWSRLSTAISRFSRSSLAYLVDDESSEPGPRVDQTYQPPEKNMNSGLPRTKDNQMEENDAEKRRRRRTGMVGKSVPSLSMEPPAKEDSSFEEPPSVMRDKDVRPRPLDDNRAETQASAVSKSPPGSHDHGLPTLGSSSMDSLLAYLTETADPIESQSTDPPRKLTMSPRSVLKPNGHPKVSRNATSRSKLEESKEVLSTPTSPLLTLVKNISSQGIKKIGTSSYEAWLSNVPSPILKSPRNDGYRKLQQTHIVNERRSEEGNRREGRHESRRGLGLQVDGEDLAQTTSSTTKPVESEQRNSVKPSTARRSSSGLSLSESRKSNASLPDAQEGLNKALAALDELARGLKSNRRAMSVSNNKDTDTNLPARDFSTPQSRPSRKSLAKSRAFASVDHKPGTVLPLQIKQKARSTSIDVNAQSASQRTPFLSRNPQLEFADHQVYDKADFHHQAPAFLADDDAPLHDIIRDFDIRVPSPRRDSVASIASSISSSPEKRASQRLDWCRESLTPRFNHLAAILEGRDDPPPPMPKYAGSVVIGKGKTKQA